MSFENSKTHLKENDFGVQDTLSYGFVDFI